MSVQNETLAKIDALVQRMDAYLEREIATGQTNTIRVDGGIVATISCVAMLFVVLALMIFESRSYNDLSRKVDKEATELRQELTPQLDQLRAWNDVNRGKIAVLEARTSPSQEKK